MAKGDEIIEEVDTKKSKREKKKKEKKNKKNASTEGAVAGQDGVMYTDAEEEEEGGLSIAIIIILIIIIWFAILCLLIKLDVGGFGSNFLYPVLKDVPVINKILPNDEFSLPDESNQAESEFSSLSEAVAEVERLRRENEQLKASPSGGDANEEQIAAMREEITRLKTFEDSQVEFQRVKTEFYEEVIFSDKAPSIEEYRKYYESINPENAEYLYKQVITQLEADKELDDYVKAYSEMKPKSAAAVFEEMGDNLDLVAKILGKMDADTRAKILNVMDPILASKLTKIMNPE
ncbi:MAG: hypothetical protein K6B28_00895 [Lachnospiraceae bacterium]|nr:hypothetical protein [Lachnospiraceae bacterium]